MTHESANRGHCHCIECWPHNCGLDVIMEQIFERWLHPGSRYRTDRAEDLLIAFGADVVEIMPVRWAAGSPLEAEYLATIWNRIEVITDVERRRREHAVQVEAARVAHRDRLREKREKHG